MGFFFEIIIIVGIPRTEYTCDDRVGPAYQLAYAINNYNRLCVRRIHGLAIESR